MSITIHRNESTVSEVWGCPRCGCHYTDRMEAVACCTSAKQMWQCDACGEGWSSKEGAISCCQGISCDNCGEWFTLDEEEEARACCPQLDEPKEEETPPEAEVKEDPLASLLADLVGS